MHRTDKGEREMKITLAIPEGKKGMAEFLKKELSQAQNIKSKQTRQQVTKGLNKLLFRQDYSSIIFYYDGDTDELTQEPYDGIDFVYHCGHRFVIPEKQPEGQYLLIAMDSTECTIGVLQGKGIKTIWHDTSLVPGKSKPGGQSAQRYARGREEALKQWYKHVAQKIQEIVLNGKV